VLSNIFKALKEDVIFNHQAIKNLHYFTLLSLWVGPALYLLVHYVIMQKENYRDIHNLILLIIFGIVALFLTNIFKKGARVQNENDLTI
jgi:Mn2+/Fe2+ NRAMP family transporter